MPTHIDNVPDVIQERDIDIQTRGDQPSSLEQVVVVLLPSSSGLIALERRGRRGELPVLVDGGEILGNVIVESVEHDQQDANSRGHAQKTFVGKAIGLQLPILEGPDRVLHLLVAAIQR